MRRRPAWLAGGLLLCISVGAVSGSPRQKRGIEPENPNESSGKVAYQGPYYALVIGNNDYANLPPLQTAVGDAEAVAQVLTDKYGFHVKLLMNASRDEIIGALNEYRRELDDRSNLLIYYAGHGQFDREANRYYWLPVNAKPNDNTNWIIADDVTSDIRGTKSAHVLVVSDSCYSGTMRAADVSFDPRDRDRLLKKMMAGHSRDLLASGGNEPVSDAGSAGHSVFAAAFLHGIDSEPDTAFSGDELFQRYIKTQVGGNARQTPSYGPLGDSGHSFGDFVFVRKGTQFAYDPSIAPPALETVARSSGGGSEGPTRSITTDLGTPAVKAALLAPDLEGLARMSSAGLKPAVVEEAFRQFAGDGKTTVAQQFFENTASSPQAIAWLDSELAAGMDPNILVPNDYFGHEAILAVAMRAGNVGAAKALLQHGASPHTYEDLFLTRFTAPRFLFPLDSIVGDSRFSMDEKRDLTKAFLSAGAIVPEAVAAGARSNSSEMQEAVDLSKNYETKMGMKLTPSEPCCKVPGPICKNASARTGTDWCAIVAALPGSLSHVVNQKNGNDSPFYDLTLPYLLSITNNNAYFLGRTAAAGWYGPEYVLVAITKDASAWTIYKYMSPQAGMGLCKKDADDGNDVPRPEYCWRKISLYRNAGTDELHCDLFDSTWKIVKR